MPTTKNTWNLKLLYKSDKDPQIEKDLRVIESAFEKFEKKYKGKYFTSSVSKLQQALKDFSALVKILSGYKPLIYFNLRKDLDATDEVSQAKATQIGQRLDKAGNKSTFFRLTLGKIPEKDQKKFLKASELKDFHYMLKVTFENAKHYLSEGEENLASLLTQPGYTMWVDGQEKLQNTQTIKFKNKVLSLGQAGVMIQDLPKKDRYFVYAEIIKILKSISHFAEAEINAICNFRKIIDEERKYEKPYSATTLIYENEEREVENLVSLVTKNFKISQRFYKLHAKLLKEKKIKLADRGVKIGEIKKKFDFNKTIEILKRVFDKIDPKYTKIFESFIKNGQIDVYPKRGKHAGAYCMPGKENNPTFVLLNHVDTMYSLETLAHEMGHAFHSEMSKSQPSHYQEYTTSVAEVASTFFEQVALSELEGELSEKEYAILMHNKLKGDISTIFRQIAFFNFELELHNKIRKEGQVSKEEIAKLMSKHLRSYLGPAVEVTDDDGYFFVYLSHMRRFFYVYTYAYGQLISRALFEKWQEDKSYAKKVEQFLRAGGSMSPKDIFKSIGIDTSNPKFFALGLKSIEKDIAKLEKLTKKG